jgi:hypothetical protein
VESSSGGHGPNEAPFSRGVKEALGVDEGFKTSPLDPGIRCFLHKNFTLLMLTQRDTGADTRWALYIAVFVVLLGLVLLLAYYLLPQNAFQRSFWSVLTLFISISW